MTSRTHDIRCSRCKTYLFSIQPLDPTPPQTLCDDCLHRKPRKKGKKSRKTKRGHP